MNVRNILVLLAVVALLFVGWLLFANKTPVVPPPVSEQVEDEGLEHTVTEEGDRLYSEETDLYIIRATYPTAVNKTIQDEVDEVIKDQIGHFKAESVTLITDEEAERLREARRHYELGIDYEAHESERYISYVFTMYLDTGGAHPNAFYQTVTFNKTGELIELEDLFVGGAPYLPRLSEEVYPRILTELTARTGAEVTPQMTDVVRMGTAPSPETLQFFYVEGDSLHMLFPPYQVAAYAAGSFDIAIPFIELEDILKPELRSGSL